MSSVKKYNQEFFFKIYGDDPGTSKFLKRVVVTFIATVVFSLFFLIPPSRNRSFIIFLIIAAGIIILFIFFRIVLKGYFARYQVIIDGRTVRSFDKHLNIEMFSIEFIPENLFVANTISKYGHLYRMQRALIYSEHELKNVEETIPATDLIVLCAGPEYEINKVKNSLIMLHNERKI